MDIQTIPFHGNYIVYRPLQRLAFVANDELVRRIAQRRAGGIPPRALVDDFLDEIGF